MRKTTALLSCSLLLVSQFSTALSNQSPDEGVYFSHKDWTLVCDNTRTCRAIGFSSSSVEPAVSVRLTRQAGPQQAVHAEVGFADLGETREIEIRIDGRLIGQMSLTTHNIRPQLSAKQTQALLQALSGNTQIEWHSPNSRQVWKLSDQGAAAVLVKMDEFQGRLNTIGARIRKGPDNEDVVLPAQPMPVITPAAVNQPLRLIDIQLTADLKQYLQQTAPDILPADVRQSSKRHRISANSRIWRHFT